MNLLVDIGNSAIKWGSSDGGRQLVTGRAEHAGRKPGELLAELWAGLGRPERVLCASVAGEAWSDALRIWCGTHWQLAPEFVSSEADRAGVHNGYREPGRLGVDRWMALLGAWHAWGGPACIIDAGTALTIDALDADGRHLGGLIMPGVELMRRSLFSNTQGISDEAPGEAALLGTDTRAAVTGGTLFAAVAGIERVVADLQQALGPALQLVLTGGEAGRLLPLLRGSYRHDPDLVLRGLAVIAGEGR